MLSRSSSRAAAAAAGNSEPRDQLHIEKEDTKYTGYLDGILRDYSVKQTSSERNPFEFDEKSPKEIQTGTVTKIGQRNLSNWNTSPKRRVEVTKNSERTSTNRHALTKAKAVTLLCRIRHRKEQPIPQQLEEKEQEEQEEEDEEEDVDNILPPAVRNSSVVSPFTLTQSKYVSPAKSKGMIKSFNIFEIDSSIPHFLTEDSDTESSPQNSRRNSKEPTSGVIFPKINETNRTRTQSTLFVNPTITDTSGTGNDSSEELKSQKTTPSVTHPQASQRKPRDRRHNLTKRQSSSSSSPSPLTSSSSSTVAKALKLKGRSNLLQEAADSDSVYSSLSSDQASKYFGNNSKSIFFETYRELHHLRDNVLGGNEEIDHYITLPERDLDREIDHYSASRSLSRSRHHHDSTSIVSNLDESSTILTQDDDDDYQDSLNISSLESPLSSAGAGGRHRFASIVDNICPPPSRLLPLPSTDDGSLSTMEVDSNTVQFSQMSQLSESSQMSKRSFTPSSPRAKYLAGCLRNNVPPRSSLLLRDNISSCLMLEHQGIGDKMAELLSTGLLDIPYITSVNIADNNLTDTSLTLIINAIAHRPSITELNISRNKVGSSTARALGNYLKTPECTLKIITMRASNVDDTECHQFVDALGYNRHLEELDLSENLLGKDENLNAVKPDTVTAGESFAVLLHDCRCPIKTLKLAWNMIRMEGAVQLCGSLQYQRHLRHLDLSFNSLGREGGLVLGNSLLDNHVLEELLISNNSIDSMACFAICVGIREGKSIRYLNIDGNPIGEAGARILMRLPASYGSGMTFTARNCELTMKQSGCWFNPTDPVCQEVALDMSNPYDLSVMYEMLDLIARHPSYQFSRVQFGEDLETKNWKDMNFVYLEETHTSFSLAETETLAKLKRTVEISENFELCTQYFQASDSDGSGELSEDEFFDILDRLELSLSPRQKISAMTLYDSDRSGAIQLEEFQEFISEVAKDSRLKIRDIETSPRCAYPGEVINSSSNTSLSRYLPPRRGVFVITIVNGYQMDDTGRALTEEQVKNMIAMAKNSSSPTTLLQYAASSDLLHLNEAQEIFNHIVTECGDTALALAAIIPNMTSTTEAKNLITLCAGATGGGGGAGGGGGSETEELISMKLKLQFGNAYRPMIGLADGFYSLDFHCENDRLCMKKLLELSTTYASQRKGKRLGDVSQDGNWSCFRNESFSGQEVRLSTAFLSSMPRSGHVEFDFLGSDRSCGMPYTATPRHNTSSPRSTSSGSAVNQSVICITDRKIIQILIQINLLSSAHIHWGYDELTTVRAVCRKSLSTGGSTPYWLCSMGRVLEAQRYKYEKFTLNLNDRKNQMERAIKREQKYATTVTSSLSAASAVAGISSTSAAAVAAAGGGGVSSSGGPTSKVKRLLSKKSVGLTSLGIVSDDEEEEDDSSTGLGTGLGLSDEGDPFYAAAVAASALASVVTSPLPTASSSPAIAIRKSSSVTSSQQQQTLRKSSLATSSTSVSSSSSSSSENTSLAQAQAYAFCAKIVHQLESLLSNKWILVRHLILIMKCFSIGSLKKTDYGTYRVEVVVSLFCRLKDTHNFHLLFSSITSEEHGMLLARIGILNIFDPLRLEGSYSLDLSLWEERQVCKMLIHIAAIEPGANWLTQLFQYDRNTKPIAGWVLTVNWYSEEGLPKKGIVSLAYTCGYGIRMNNCCPVMRHRQSLLGLVLHRSDFYQYDDTNPHSEGILTARQPSLPISARGAETLSSARSTSRSTGSRGGGGGIGTLEDANEMLASLDVQIQWNYDPPCLAHE